MKHILTFLLSISFISYIDSQTFIRSELPTPLETPWEMTYGPDSFLWITEAGGVISRVHPETGAKQRVYEAPDFYEGSPLEQNPLCFMPNIGSGTLGLDLHPDFLNQDNAYIYFVYSYNEGTEEAPDTRFKLSRLTWDWQTLSVTEKTDLVTGISNGYDHWGGRLMAIVREGTPYLFLSSVIMASQKGMILTAMPIRRKIPTTSRRILTQTTERSIDTIWMELYLLTIQFPAIHFIPEDTAILRGLCIFLTWTCCLTQSTVTAQMMRSISSKQE